MKPRRQSLLFFLTFLGLVLASVVAILLKPTVLGLDLAGGSQITLEGQETRGVQVSSESIDRSVEIFRGRVDRQGVSEATISTQNGNQIVVQLPGEQDPNVLARLIDPAQMAFYNYEASLANNVGQNPTQTPEGQETSVSAYELVKRASQLPPNLAAKTPKQYFLFGTGARKVLQDGFPVTNKNLLNDADGKPLKGEVVILPAGYAYVVAKDGFEQAGESVAIFKDEPAISGDDLQSSRVVAGQGSDYDVQPVFSDKGTEAFATLTKDLARKGRLRGVQQHFAIVLDGELVSNPVIDYEQNPNGLPNGGVITGGGGGFEIAEANALSDKINSGALPIKMVRVEGSTVSATLGKQDLRQALIAAFTGLAFVMVFMGLYYRGLGLVANLALLAYGVLFLAVIKLVPITLTLPGIAGMVLTIGVAADANVVIFERIREEARAGRSPRAAVQNGYRKGISAIIDANVVTLITAAIIYLLATGGPKGFAFTLFVGVVLSLLSSVLATRAVFGLLVDSSLFQNERFMGYNQREVRWKFDFVGKWRLWLAISLVPMLIGIAFIGTKGIERGLDFRGGTAITTSYPDGQLPTERALRDALAAVGQTDARVQASTDAATGKQQFLITTKTLQPAEEATVKSTLRTNFNATFGFTNSVGASFGSQLIKNAVVAILFSFLVIIGYLSFRFEYKLALPALLSVIHDVWLCLSIYSLTGREVTNATVAALLTILGYSLYDVVIVFDRIRENAPIMRGHSYRAIVNRSVHETLTRSIITSVLTLLPVVALFFFGGETLKDFSFALLVGILSGGISSILIAAPLAALWKEREPDAQKQERREAKRLARQTDGDSDVVDLAALARAEAQLKADDPGLRSNEPVGLDGLTEPVEDVRAAADVPAPAASDDAPTPRTVTDGEASDRERRHRQVQRKRRKR